MTTLSDGTTTITPLLVLGYEDEQSSGNIGHDLIGGGDAITLGRAGLRESTLRLLFETEQDAADCIAMHTAAGRFTLASTERPTVSMQYVVAPNGRLARRLEPVTRSLWIVEIDVKEVT